MNSRSRRRAQTIGIGRGSANKKFFQKPRSRGKAPPWNLTQIGIISNFEIKILKLPFLPIRRLSCNCCIKFNKIHKINTMFSGSHSKLSKILIYSKFYIKNRWFSEFLERVLILKISLFSNINWMQINLTSKKKFQG